MTTSSFRGTPTAQPGSTARTTSRGHARWLDVKRQLEDVQAAVDFAHTLEDVDTSRIALWGYSFGGGHVMRTAARDPRVAAVVAQSPFTSGPASLRALGPRNTLRVLPVALHDLVAARVPDGVAFDFTVDARIVNHVPFNSPGRAVGEVRCPILFSVCEKDAITPAGPTLRYAKKARHGEVTRYPIDHVDICSGPDFERAVADQTEFLVRHLR